MPVRIQEKNVQDYMEGTSWKPSTPGRWGSAFVKGEQAKRKAPPLSTREAKQQDQSCNAPAEIETKDTVVLERGFSQRSALLRNIC